ncbi:GNAT family N-acetyltransferase [Kitasatospora sp. NPDC001540]|uniref:GNAT family N-acetyltransferase n=1 Tax=Kitasatospora sp. NPDC001540 TaxID=3364014 RepID=UPI0036795404
MTTGTGTDGIELTHYQHGQLPESFRELLLQVHADAYADQMDDEFVQKFAWFVDHWSSLPGFTCVVGRDADTGEAVGFAYGAPATMYREWWREHLEQAPADSSTYALSELMVRPAWRKRGVSRLLHDALLADRPEALVVLLVDPGHPRVKDLYESWGYRQVGYRQPFADSPRYAVMLRELAFAAV